MQENTSLVTNLEVWDQKLHAKQRLLVQIHFTRSWRPG
jgi:hypothetical protein